MKINKTCYVFRGQRSIKEKKKKNLMDKRVSNYSPMIIPCGLRLSFDYNN